MLSYNQASCIASHMAQPLNPSSIWSVEEDREYISRILSDHFMLKFFNSSPKCLPKSSSLPQGIIQNWNTLGPSISRFELHCTVFTVVEMLALMKVLTTSSG